MFLRAGHLRPPWSSAPSRRRWRPEIEPLEDRFLLSTFVVNSTADYPDGDSADGVADTGYIDHETGEDHHTGICTLRAAIMQANAEGVPAEIPFDIEGEGPHTIFTPGLPFITVPIVIDGTTQPGFDPGHPTPMIEIAGPRIGLGAPPGLPWSGLVIGGGSSTVRGLVINGFSGAGIALTSDGNTVEGNFIGTDATGTATADGLGNFFGVLVVGSHNTVGGTTAAARNVISGNSLSPVSKGVHIIVGMTGNTVEGNFIGTDVTGIKALPNGIGVCINGFENTVGGTAAGAGNVISGNVTYGVMISGGGTKNVIEGNRIGTQVDGAGALGNGLYGVCAADGSDNRIGGTDAGAGNTVAFNGGSFLPRPQGHGIMIAAGTGNTIRRNSVFKNAGRGIALGTASWADTLNDVAETELDADGRRVLTKAADRDGGPNRLQNYPVLTSVVSKDGRLILKGVLDSAPKTTYALDFFTNDETDPSGFGEGRTFFGGAEVTTDDFGHADIALDFESAGSGRYVSATATDTKTKDTSALSMVDTDGDGLADAWEKDGIDIDEDGTVDLTLAGADPNHKDVYVEVDAMQDRAPAVATLGLVVDAFAAAPNDLVHNPDARAGVTLHADRDETDIPRMAFPNDWADFAVIKRDRFGTPEQRADPNHDNLLKAKGLVYRYCLFADTHDGGSESGESRGFVTNDFMVTLGSVPDEAHGGWLLPGPDGVYGTADDLPGTTREQAGTFMHELGHALGLHHGGGGSDANGDGDDTKYKPNYHSVMNYTWQMPYRLDAGDGSPEDPKGGSADEKAFYNSWVLDYSRAAMPTLDEARLVEANGIGGHAGHTLQLRNWLFVPESGAVDWNGDGRTDENLGDFDVNGDHRVGMLVGHEDWSELTYSFLESQSYKARGDEAHGSEELSRERPPPAKPRSDGGGSPAAPGNGIPTAPDASPTPAPGCPVAKPRRGQRQRRCVRKRPAVGRHHVPQSHAGHK